MEVSSLVFWCLVEARPVSSVHAFSATHLGLGTEALRIPKLLPKIHLNLQ